CHRSQVQPPPAAGKRYGQRRRTTPRASARRRRSGWAFSSVPTLASATRPAYCRVGDQVKDEGRRSASGLGKEDAEREPVLDLEDLDGAVPELIKEGKQLHHLRLEKEVA